MQWKGGKIGWRDWFAWYPVRRCEWNHDADEYEVKWFWLEKVQVHGKRSLYVVDGRTIRSIEQATKEALAEAAGEAAGEDFP